MAGKQILGDDPFATDDAPPPPPAAAEKAPPLATAEQGTVKNAGTKKSNSGSKEKKGKENEGKGARAAKEPAEAKAAASAETKSSASMQAKPSASVETKSAETKSATSSEATSVASPDALSEPATDDATATEPASASRSFTADAGQGSESAEPVSPSLAFEASVEAPAPRAQSAAAASETYISVEQTPPSEYGPSIDRPPPAGPRHGLVDEVRHIERSVRDRLLPSRAGEHGGERQRLPLEFLWQRWRKLAMRDRSDVVDEFGRDPNVAARTEPLLDFLYRSYFRVEARGLGHIPDTGRGLIVANHSGTLPYDGAMIMHAVRSEHRAQREVRPLVEDFVFHFPYLGTLMNRIGGVRACPENAERLLQQDQLVAVFPEGIKGIGKLFRERYQLQRFGRGGFVKLALKSDTPIIPTAVIGAEEVHPMVTKVTWLAKAMGIPYIPITPTFPFLGVAGLVPLPTKWYIAFGEPLYFNAEYGADGANDRILVNKLAEQVRTRIQEMLDGLLKQRRSILFG